MKKFILLYFESDNENLIDVLKNKVLPKSDSRLWQGGYICISGPLEDKYYLSAQLFFNKESDRGNFRSILGPFNGLSGTIKFANSYHDEKVNGNTMQSCQLTNTEVIT